jgi:Flp pilus assembly protein TadG
MQVDCAARGYLSKVAALVCRLRSAGRAQSAVEFAIALPLLLITLLVGIQYAIIGEAALALGQVNYQGARYASLNTTANQSAVQAYMLSVASPTIAANSGAYLSSNLSPTPPCTSGSTITVSVTFDANHLLVLPSTFTLPFIGSISFPTTLTSSESALCEGSTN